ncbi:hypothetical protein HQQ80_17845 [Microbacteriaceae bacterium VKM Ac-2855]|nr:hypothetical protein [Microbacteriaceae bacterium VKM Ac-2855]
MWDFSWYVRTGPGEPFEDLERAVADAAERGYNTVRICAMPFLLFESGLDTTRLELDRLGGAYAQGVRWYDVKTPSVIDAREHLLRLFRALRDHDMFAIVSSWEYQQSSSFATSPDWWNSLRSIDPDGRAVTLARAEAALLDFLDEHGMGDRVAFTELHNEVQYGHLAEGVSTEGGDVVLGLTDRLERGLAAFHARRPSDPVTVNYAHVPVGSMRGIPKQVDVLVFHPYVYGVLDEVTAAFDLRGALADFPRAAVEAVGILRPDAPDPESWILTGEDAWKMEATIVGKPEIYLHDWIDAEAFDRFLYERYQVHAVEMNRILTTWLDVAADAAAARGVPVVFGEGWVGYTPLYGNFEEGPIGAAFCRFAIAESVRVGAWGTIVCSNAAPQHPMWSDIRLQQECNTHFLGAAARASDAIGSAP